MAKYDYLKTSLNVKIQKAQNRVKVWVMSNNNNNNNLLLVIIIIITIIYVIIINYKH